MTTTITISAHCDESTEVRVSITEKDKIIEDFRVQNNQTAFRYIYGDRMIHIAEVDKK